AAVPYGGGAAVGVRVVGDDQVRSGRPGLREGQVHRAGLLRVGERDGGEVGVGLGLLGDQHWLGEAGPGEGGEQHVLADAVHGRVDGAGGTGGVRREDRVGAGEVGVQDAVAQGLPAVGGAGGGGQIGR